MHTIKLGDFEVQSEKDTAELQDQIDSFIVLLTLMGYGHKFMAGLDEGDFKYFLTYFKDMGNGKITLKGSIMFVCKDENHSFYMVRFNNYEYDRNVELYDIDQVTEQFKKIHDWVE